MMENKKEKNKSIGIIGRGKHGYQTANEMRKFFEVVEINLPEELPEVIESIDDLKELESLNKVFNCDIVICYASHDDISLIVAENCKSLAIITGECGKGIKRQVSSIAERRGVKVLMPEICCTVRAVKGFEWFFKHYGKPEFKLKVKEGRISEVEVKRCAFCGATRFVAEKLIGCKVEEAPRLAGLYTQIYPCMASRGIKGRIHLAAEMHRRAVIKALAADT